MIVGLDGLDMLGLLQMYHVFTMLMVGLRRRTDGREIELDQYASVYLRNLHCGADRTFCCQQLDEHQTGKKGVSDLGLRGRPAALACRSREQSAGRPLGVELGVSCFAVWLRNLDFYLGIAMKKLSVCLSVCPPVRQMREL